MGILDWLAGKSGGVVPEESKMGKNVFRNINGEEAARKVASDEFLVLDVRTEREYQAHHIPGAILIPLQQLSSRHSELDPQKPMLVFCEHGMRSVQACRFLSQLGFSSLCNVNGGMAAYPGPREGSAVRG
jgi:rhodanese-related sulfurtransferase